MRIILSVLLGMIMSVVLILLGYTQAICILIGVIAAVVFYVICPATKGEFKSRVKREQKFIIKAIKKYVHIEYDYNNNKYQIRVFILKGDEDDAVITMARLSMVFTSLVYSQYLDTIQVTGIHDRDEIKKLRCVMRREADKKAGNKLNENDGITQKNGH